VTSIVPTVPPNAGHPDRRKENRTMRTPLQSLPAFLFLLAGLVACAPVDRGRGGGSYDDVPADADDADEQGDDDDAVDDDADDDASDADDDDATDDDDDDDDTVVVASGTYTQEIDWVEWAEIELGYSDCTAVWELRDAGREVPVGCPGCDAVFSIEFVYQISTCDSSFDPNAGDRYVFAGVSGTTIYKWFESEGDWFRIAEGFGGGGSITAMSDWFDYPSEGFRMQEVYVITW